MQDLNFKTIQQVKNQHEFIIKKIFIQQKGIIVTRILDIKLNIVYNLF